VWTAEEALDESRREVGTVALAIYGGRMDVLGWGVSKNAEEELRKIGTQERMLFLLVEGEKAQTTKGKESPKARRLGKPLAVWRSNERTKPSVLRREEYEH